VDYKTFIVQIVNILVWPVLILTIIFYFKEELRKFLKSISELKIGHFSIVLEKNIVANAIYNSSIVKEDVSEKPEMTREEIFNIPDDDYEFMQKIANNESFMPTNQSEVFKYNSLVNHGYFEKVDDIYKPTKKGQEIITALKSIYYP
jgi:hypothetical protein